MLTYEFANRLGDPRRCFDSLARQVRKLRSHDSRKLLSTVSRSLQGIERTLALERLSKGCPTLSGLFLEIRLPPTGLFSLRSLIHPLLKKVLRGPLYINYLHVPDRRVTDVLSNQRY